MGAHPLSAARPPPPPPPLRLLQGPGLPAAAAGTPITPRNAAPPDHVLGGSVGSEHAGGLPPPEEVVATRGGDVLLPHTILKSDHFPGEGAVHGAGGVGPGELPSQRSAAL